MSKRPNPTAHARRLLPSQWASIVELYELGEKNQRQLAKQFGVSSTAIQKGLKKRGAVKGCRVEESPALIELKRQLDRKARAKKITDDAAFERMNERTALIGELIDMLVEADRRGSLAELGPIFREVRRAL